MEDRLVNDANEDDGAHSTLVSLPMRTADQIACLTTDIAEAARTTGTAAIRSRRPAEKLLPPAPRIRGSILHPSLVQSPHAGTRRGTRRS